MLRSQPAVVLPYIRICSSQSQWIKKEKVSDDAETSNLNVVLNSTFQKWTRWRRGQEPEIPKTEQFPLLSDSLDGFKSSCKGKKASAISQLKFTNYKEAQSEQQIEACNPSYFWLLSQLTHCEDASSYRSVVFVDSVLKDEIDRGKIVWKLQRSWRNVNSPLENVIPFFLIFCNVEISETSPWLSEILDNCSWAHLTGIGVYNHR